MGWCQPGTYRSTLSTSRWGRSFTQSLCTWVQSPVPFLPLLLYLASSFMSCRLHPPECRDLGKQAEQGADNGAHEHNQLPYTEKVLVTWGRGWRDGLVSKMLTLQSWGPDSNPSIYFKSSVLTQACNPSGGEGESENQTQEDCWWFVAISIAKNQWGSGSVRDPILKE